MAKAANDWTRCYHGTIRRETDDDGNPICYGKIKIGDGYIITRARDQWELGDRLDAMVLMILDFGLHNDEGKTSLIASTPYFLN